RMTIDDGAMIPRLAESLGYLREQGLELEEIDIHGLTPNDFEMQQPLIDGRVDVAYHWFQHSVFGARHDLPIKAVMAITDAPGMTVLVANRVKDQIRGAADLKGRHVAEGAAYATKSTLMNYLALREGLAPRSYVAVAQQTAGRQEKIIQGLEAGGVDVVACMEPQTAAIRATQRVSTLYDLTSKAATTELLGASLPSESLLMAPAFIEQQPETAQRIVNAFVKTMRFVNSSTAEQIADALPSNYFEGKVRDAEIERIRNTLPSYAQGNYAFADKDVALLVDTIVKFPFDDSPAGQWRNTSLHSNLEPAALYTNDLVLKAMQTFPAN
ncbi:ABC transporter substrate-binding protein, partial [Steroidobacter sp.]|uniref:ABC transporter substrate-binding protein n=1 Tax=Steroidobacter sp. TaxID=1978227 RepID=UPI001A49FC27